MRSRLLAGVIVAAGALVAASSAVLAQPMMDPEGRFSGGAPAGRGNYSFMGGSSIGGSSPVPRSTVSFPASYSPGTVIVNTTERRLYYVNGDGTAIRYGIGVGRI